MIFKIDAPPAKGEDAGSRFGFDAEAVRKAVTGEGNVPPGFGSISSRTLGWNHLPALLAADLWREYLAKFTLAQLFETDQSPPPEPSGSSGPVPAETQVSYEPASLAGGEGLAGMLHELNVWLARLADRCEFSGKDVVRVKPDTPKPAPESPPNVEKEQVDRPAGHQPYGQGAHDPGRGADPGR